MTATIVDLSHHNGSVDFARLKAAGVAAVIHKATQGTSYVDPKYVSRRAAAKAAGMPWGAYHMCEPGQDAKAQIDHFLEVVGRSEPPELRLALDVELPTHLHAAAAAANYNRMAEYLQQRVGYVPIVYTYPSYAAEGYCAGLGDELLWMADYSGGLDVPAEWGHDIRRAVIWQHGQKQIPGASAGDGPGVDWNTAPSLAPLLIPTKKEDDVLNADDKKWLTEQLMPRLMDDPATAHGQVPVTQVIHSIARAQAGIPAAIAKVAAAKGVTLPADFADAVAAEFGKDLVAGAGG
ncbi:MAG: glycoside hydrolase family 25 protein [Frankiaceae bacterium]|jgi:lysozyme